MALFFMIFPGDAKGGTAVSQAHWMARAAAIGLRNAQADPTAQAMDGYLSMEVASNAAKNCEYGAPGARYDQRQSQALPLYADGFRLWRYGAGEREDRALAAVAPAR